MEVLWKKLEVCDTRGSRCKYVGVYRSLWKLPRNLFVEAAIDGSNGRFQFIDNGNFHVLPWKAPLTSLEVNLLSPTSIENFHGS